MAITYPVLSNYEALAAGCLVDAGILNQHLNSAGTDVPEAKIKELRTKLFESAQSLLQAVTPPEYTLTQGLSTSIMDLTVFRYISRYEVAKGVPTTSSISYEDLAVRLSVDPVQLKRIFRYAMTKRVFTETLSGQVAHTGTSLLLLQDGIATMNRYSTNRAFPIAASFNDAIEKWGHGAQESNQTAFNVAFNTDLPLFDHLATDAAYARDFHHVMKFFSKTPPMSIDHIKRAFDWSSLPANATVVDVGGSLGHCSLAILEANPLLSCIVQDLPEVVTQATNPTTSVVPKHLASRISYQPHSFWDEQPLSADCYFMRMIFHDWPHKYSQKILRSLVAGMRPGAKLLIMDYVTLEPGKLKPADEKRVRMRDLQMMIMHNALERDAGEWRQLLAESDSRLRLVNIQTPPGSALSILEIVLDDYPAAETVEHVAVVDQAADKIDAEVAATTVDQQEAGPGPAVTADTDIHTSADEPAVPALDHTAPGLPHSKASSSSHSRSSSREEPQIDILPLPSVTDAVVQEPIFSVSMEDHATDKPTTTSSKKHAHRISVISLGEVEDLLPAVPSPRA